MSNANVPATAEGMTEFHLEKRIAELASEIASMMDRTRKLGNLTVFPASTGIEARYEAGMHSEQPRSASILIGGIDALNEGKACVDLVNLALDSLSGDIKIRAEINALQYGMLQVERSLLAVKEKIEEASQLAKTVRC